MSLVTYIKKLALSLWFQSALLLLICLFATLQAIGNDEIANFVIFKTATQRFLSHTNMYEYIEYGIIWDQYLYAPCFVMLFLPFAYLPVGISIFLWLAAGAALFFFALKKLPLTETQRAIVFFVALIDLVNSLQNLQTNALNTAFMLLIFSSLHNQKPVWAGFFTALCLGIKIYPAASALLFLFYPGKLKFLGSTALFTVALFFLPFLFVPADYYLSCLQSWKETLIGDAGSYEAGKSASLIGANYTWLARPIDPLYLQVGGLLLVFLPLFKLLKKQVNLHFILLYLSLIMLFVVIFNHAAESPTYVIALTGVAIWYAASPKKLFEHILLALVFAGCVFLPTDLYPKWLRAEYFVPLKIRVIPVTILWLKILYDLISYKPKTVEA